MSGITLIDEDDDSMFAARSTYGVAYPHLDFEEEQEEVIVIDDDEDCVQVKDEQAAPMSGKSPESPTKRPYSSGRAKSRNMGWTVITGGEDLSQGRLGDFLKADNAKKAAGLGYHVAGQERNTRAADGNKCTRKVQRCGYFNEKPSCPAQRVIVTNHITKRSTVLESTGEGAMHNDHTGSRVKGCGMSTPCITLSHSPSQS
jgi:hypothetical protein